MSVKFLRFLPLILLASLDPLIAAGSGTDYKLSIFLGNLSGGQAPRELKAHSLSELQAKKLILSQERDPKTQQIATWKGVLLSGLIDEAMGQLPPELKAQVDLVVLKGKDGKEVLVPRSFIVKYPVLLALSRNGKGELGDLGPVFSVVPWSSRPKVSKELLPIESYFLSRVTQIELTNYRDRYPLVFLKRRTDPAAMRGEKLFVQNCVSCHNSKSKTLLEDKAGTLGSAKHPDIEGSPKLASREWRYITQYVEAYRTENP